MRFSHAASDNPGAGQFGGVLNTKIHLEQRYISQKRASHDVSAVQGHTRVGPLKGMNLRPPTFTIFR